MAVLETLIVALLVAWSATFVAWRLTPARRRVQVLDRLAPDTARVWGRWIAALRRRAAADLAHGCGACRGGISGGGISRGAKVRTGKAAAPRR